MEQFSNLILCLWYLTRVSRLEKRRNEDIRRIMNMEESVNERIENRQLQWCGHVRRMVEKRWPNILLHWSPAGRRKKGRPRTPWRSVISRMMDERELDEWDWNDRHRWKMGVKGNHWKVESPSTVKRSKYYVHNFSAACNTRDVKNVVTHGIWDKETVRCSRILWQLIF